MLSERNDTKGKLYLPYDFIYRKFKNLQNQQSVIKIRILVTFWDGRVFRRASELSVMFCILAWMAFITSVHFMKINVFFYFCNSLLKSLFFGKVRGINWKVGYKQIHTTIYKVDKQEEPTV